jgi:hypothetical protein
LRLWVVFGETVAEDWRASAFVAALSFGGFCVTANNGRAESASTAKIVAALVEYISLLAVLVDFLVIKTRNEEA